MKKGKKKIAKKPDIQRRKVRKYLFDGGYTVKGENRFAWKSKEIARASDLIEKELKKRGLKSTRANVRKIISELIIQPGKKKPKLIYPAINDDLFKPQQYFDISRNLLPEIANWPTNLWLRGPMILGKNVYLEGSILYTHESTFKPWVEFIDDLRKSSGDDSRYTTEWFWCLNVDFGDMGFGIKWVAHHNRFEVELISCDKNGRRENYGYLSNKGKRAQPQVSAIENARTIEEEPTKETSPAPKEESTKVDVVKDAEVKAVKRKSDLEILIQKKKSVMEDVKNWKELGADFKSELNESIAELKKLQKKISEFE